MVANFETLRERGLLVDVPVREDHTQTIGNVKGYFTAMRTDGDFLYADIEFTEPDGAEKYNRGTYRGRSIEIGTYETNGADPEEFAPAVMGLAFVDIGAVEGLYRNYLGDDGGDEYWFRNFTEKQRKAAADAGDAFPDGSYPIKTQEDLDSAVSLIGRSKNHSAAEVEAHIRKQAKKYGLTLPASMQGSKHQGDTTVTTFRIGSKDTDDAAEVQAYIRELEGRKPFKFHLATGDTRDHEKVQQHIKALETFRDESIEAGRADFVDQMVAARKIAAPQADSMKEFAKTLTPEQFTAWKQGFETAPAVFQRYAGDGDGATTPPGNTDPKVEQIEIDKEVVRNHRLGNMAEDKVQKTAAYRRLVAAGVDVSVF